MAQPTVLFPDAAELVIAAVTAGFAAQSETAPVVNEVPLERPEEFVRVRRIGGQRRDLITDEPRLSVEAWAPTVARAQDLAQLARTFIHSMEGTSVNGAPIYRVTEILGPTELPDPFSTVPRVAQTIQVAIRGTAL